MARHIDTLPRVRLSPTDWERVEAMAAAESRSVANMLGVLVREAMAARELPKELTKEGPLIGGVRVSPMAITRPERVQKGASK